MPETVYEISARRTAGAVWRIEPIGGNATWHLKFLAANGDRHLLQGYSSPQAAALAVAQGTTGVETWDKTERNEADFALQKWKKISGT